MSLESLDSAHDFIQDPLDLAGVRAAGRTVRASERAARTMGEMFDRTQANLQPFTDAGNSMLPGLSRTATPGGALDYATAYAPMSEALNRPAIEDRMRDVNSQLGASGMRRSGFGVETAADIEGDAHMSFLLSLQSFMNQRQQRIAEFGINSGMKLSRLGQDSAERTGDMLASGILSGAQTQAQGAQNVARLGAAGLSFYRQRQKPPTTTNDTPVE